MAFYHYSFEDNQNFTEYSKEELTDVKKVEELFDYCQILEAYITKSGWEFLISYYGYDKLFEMDQKSGWHDAATVEEYVSEIDYEMELGEKLE